MRGRHIRCRPGSLPLGARALLGRIGERDVSRPKSYYLDLIEAAVVTGLSRDLLLPGDGNGLRG